MADFIALGRDGKFTVADSGVGTTNHLAIELFGEATGAKYTLVHYKGSGQAQLDVIAGQVPAQVDQLNAAIGQIKAGKLRAIAVSSDKRVPQLPDVPTMKELGVKGLESFTFSTYTGLFAPAKLPPEILAKLNAAMVTVLKDPAVVQALRRPHGGNVVEHAAGTGDDARQGGAHGRAADQEARHQTGVDDDMTWLPPAIAPIVLLLISNVFMTFAWYGQR